MKNIKILKSNTVYRVNDIILRNGIRWQQDRHTILNDSRYRNSILFDYLNTMNHENDIQTFSSIVRKHQHYYQRPKENELIVHLRLGDIMDEDYKTVSSRTYYKHKRAYSNLTLDILPEVHNATIVTALHFGSNSMNGRYFYSDRARERSFEILELVTRKLKKMGMSVSYKSSENIDEDICFMAGSNYYLKSFSMLSDLVEKCLDEDAVAWSPKHFKNKNIYRLSSINSGMLNTVSRLKRLIKY